jgi:hypothetical protein
VYVGWGLGVGDLLSHVPQACCGRKDLVAVSDGLVYRGIHLGVCQDLPCTRCSGHRVVAQVIADRGNQAEVREAEVQHVARSRPDVLIEKGPDENHDRSELVIRCQCCSRLGHSGEMWGRGSKGLAVAGKQGRQKNLMPGQEVTETRWICGGTTAGSGFTCDSRRYLKDTSQNLACLLPLWLSCVLACLLACWLA